jgi:hypothetical protein
MLRHSSITITSDTYTSIMPEVAREAAELIATLVPRKVAVGRRPKLLVSLLFGLPEEAARIYSLGKRKDPQVTGGPMRADEGNRTPDLQFTRPIRAIL